MKEKARQGKARERAGSTVLSLVLQMLRAAETLELSVHHDGNTTTQSFTLLHAVSETRRKTNKQTNKQQTCKGCQF